ncbi:GNAT family N-acetyltransferase [Flavobacterium sp. FlaQc-30]|uniref:GNAT family N-acetyltransferase n=1 Tax=Flavobacterium sp. FlaQc-30 TaxID=3374179 RepID=UPI003756812D
MELLSKNGLEKHRNKIIEHLNLVSFNVFFAKNVVDQKVTGEIFVDNTEYPQIFYILHPYGMSLLLGKSSDEFNYKFLELILSRNIEQKRVEWMQVYPNEWGFRIKEILKDRIYKLAPSIELDTRVNFKFNLSKYITSKKDLTDKNILISRTSKDDFENMKGSVVPKCFWNSSDEFINNGIGYSLFYKDTLASLAFSAFVHNRYLELGIETQEQFRGRNIAYKVCSALIQYCVEEGFEPVWACRELNIGSYKLAEKLGFEKSQTTTYFKLNY